MTKVDASKTRDERISDFEQHKERGNSDTSRINKTNDGEPDHWTT